MSSGEGVRLVIDATLLRPDRTTGLERYTYNLLHSMVPRAAEHDLHVLLRSDYAVPPWMEGPRVVVHKSPRATRPVRDQSWVPTIIRWLKPAVVHLPGFPPPLAPLGPTAVVMTIHDAVYWEFPDTLSRGSQLYYKPLLRFALARRRIDLVITVSHAAAADLRRRMPAGVPIRVTHLGVDRRLRTGRQLGRRPDVVHPYILAVGTREPRKNLAMLFEAYRLLLKGPSSPPDLVVVGRGGWGQHEELPRGIGARVRILADVSDEELAELYDHCMLFAMPSTYEGFGLPLLEAMACGAPCVAADIPALREVGGTVCAYAPPDDAEQFAKTMGQILSDRMAAEDMRKRGRERSQAFTWKQCSKETLAIYGEVVSRRARTWGDATEPPPAV